VSDLTLGGWLLITTGALDILVFLAVVIVRLRRRATERRREWVRSFMRLAFVSAGPSEISRILLKHPDEFLREFMDLSDNAKLPEEQLAKFSEALVRARQFPRLIRQLSGRSRYRRKRAAIWLGYAPAEQAVRPLVLALEREPLWSVRIHIVHSLARLGDPAAIPTIVDSLAGSRADYQQRALGCLRAFGNEFASYFDIFRDRPQQEIRWLMAELAATLAEEKGQRYLEELVRAEDAATRRHAGRLLLSGYARTTDLSALLDHDDRMIVNFAVEALGVIDARETLETLVSYAASPDTRKSAVVGLSNLVHNAPALHAVMLDLIEQDENPEATDAMLEVVAQRVEYLLERVLRANDESARTVLAKLAWSGRVSGIISFLNRNEDPAAESAIVDLISAAVRVHDEVRDAFAVYARESVIRRLGVTRKEGEQTRGARVGEATRPVLILAMILGVVLTPPLAFVLIRWFALDMTPNLSWFAAYVNGFALFFGGYAFVLNMIYLALLGFAAYAVVRQQANLGIKPLSMLFRPGMVPSISIIVPAYREESTIVENVNSLMNLRYPNFEVIVVNDGSPDDTMGSLIRDFELERTDIFVHGYLGTQPIRGIYRNPQIPELLVIDKQNGGKADTLNAGINAARNDYFAAIDSDSLLERDSLLRLTAQFLDSEEPVVATVGNIFPVNGCSVDRGNLDRIALPRELLGRLQTLEYLRSFMAGRTGWAQLKSLMIISGAFGLFRKKDVVDSEGYLTGSGKYRKDTVAEDMELVVRISRTLREAGKPFAVQYAYSANCWTEVPTSLKILRNQRDRWQRGLIDTMVFHFRMLLNPKHRAIGLVGFPYFFLFELLGPWVEVQGLLFLVVGLAARTLPLSVFAIVFAATVPLGVAISLASLLLAEYHQRYFGPADRARLLFLAVMENFGYRQYASVLRLRGYISALRRKTGWGSMVRAGFAGGSPAASGTAPGQPQAGSR
jgi:cellulose synthase/poly-beta-1,6-N-acetylglucosamine synthase-like glycosyltransferase/HEAT repeat protein